ncbi:MAG: endo alpha-1,4 polygalactosaminidase [Chloroflexi bacterium]|nr:endo alpha-1,4 polygalactosaminidase [Chloroflexota bacterium]
MRRIRVLTMALMAVVAFSAHAAPRTWWQPVPGTTWQWQLSGTVNVGHDVDMYDIDLFDTPQETLDTLHLDGRIVICYFSAGSFENFRPDKDSFPAIVKGNRLDEWPGEKWLDIRNLAILGPIMEARMDLAVTKGCDGVEPDNIDGYTNDTGFPLTYSDQLTYNVWLAAEAHARGLSIGLKNDLDQIPDLVDDFDWMLNEQCYQYEECDLLLPFISANKAVFGVEYMEEQGDPRQYCRVAESAGYSWLVKTYDLGDTAVNPCSDYLPVDVTHPADGGTAATLPTIIWAEHPAGTSYRVLLTRLSNGVVRDSGWLAAASLCSASVCQYAPGKLKAGLYRLKVKTRWTGAFRKPVSPKILFTVVV